MKGARWYSMKPETAIRLRIAAKSRLRRDFGAGLLPAPIPRRRQETTRYFLLPPEMDFIHAADMFDCISSIFSPN